MSDTASNDTGTNPEVTTIPVTGPNQNWFHIRYTGSAPEGLPPVIQAEQVVRYSDDADTWVVALWVAPPGRNDVAACILRLPIRHVEAVTQHADMGEAASQCAPQGVRN